MLPATSTGAVPQNSSTRSNVFGEAAFSATLSNLVSPLRLVFSS